jgi:hypothetical protein
VRLHGGPRVIPRHLRNPRRAQCAAGAEIVPAAIANGRL